MEMGYQEIPPEYTREDLIDDEGLLELVLTDAVTDRDVLLVFQQFLKHYPLGPWALHAARLIQVLNAEVDSFYYKQMYGD